MNLEPAAQSLLEQFPGGRDPDLIRRERRLERFGQFAFGGFGLVVVAAIIGLVYTIFTKMVLSGTQPWAGILLIAFLLFAAMTLAYVIFAEDLKDKRKKMRPSPVRELEGAADTGKLLDEGQFVPIPTVTENTTDLLPSRNRER